MNVSQSQPVNHVQDNPANNWVIAHNFGYAPLVGCRVYVDGVLHDILPLDIVHSEDLKTTTIKFSSPMKGKARLA